MLLFLEPSVVFVFAYTRLLKLTCDALRIRGVVANYLASRARDPRIDSHQHQKDLFIYIAPSEERYCV